LLPFSCLHHCSGVAMRRVGCENICELLLILTPKRKIIAKSEGDADAAIGAAVISPTDRRIRRREFKGGKERGVKHTILTRDLEYGREGDGGYRHREGGERLPAETEHCINVAKVINHIKPQLPR